jgi:hypothetical protein
VNTSSEWSDRELTELGDMLVRGLPIEEIARRLRRDKIEARTRSRSWGGPADRGLPWISWTRPRPLAFVTWDDGPDRKRSSLISGAIFAFIISFSDITLAPG